MTQEEQEAAKIAADTADATGLKEQLAAAQAKINKYDGERKDYSEQTNLINDLKSQVEALQTSVRDAEDEDTKHLTVTQEELRDYQSKESERFANYTKAEATKATEKQEEYQKFLATESLSVKDEELYDEICKEHDYLVANNGMPESTGNMRADASIAWRESYNSLLRKKNAAGEKVNFQTPADATKNRPVVPAQQEVSSATQSVQTTTMPDNLPDDAKEFIAWMGEGNNPDKINKVLGG